MMGREATTFLFLSPVLSLRKQAPFIQTFVKWDQINHPVTHHICIISEGELEDWIECGQVENSIVLQSKGCEKCQSLVIHRQPRFDFLPCPSWISRIHFYLFGSRFICSSSTRARLRKERGPFWISSFYGCMLAGARRPPR